MAKKEKQRVGPGRPPLSKLDKRIKFSITLSPRGLELLDSLRGGQSRSVFLEDLLYAVTVYQ